MLLLLSIVQLWRVLKSVSVMLKLITRALIALTLGSCNLALLLAQLIVKCMVGVTGHNVTVNVVGVLKDVPVPSKLPPLLEVPHAPALKMFDLAMLVHAVRIAD
jgi:hypothetical protein